MLLIALLGCAPLAPPAAATHVSCGDTITQDTTLDSDLVGCAGDGLVIGADGVTVDLGGHRIDGAGAGAGIRSENFSGLEIRGGTITGFRNGIDTEDVRSQRIIGMTLEDNRQGADLFLNEGPAEVIDTIAARNTIGLNLDGQVRVARSRIVDNTGLGIALDFTGATIEDNLIARNRTGIELEEADAEITRNRILANSGSGITYGYWQEGKVTRNLIARNGQGINFNRSDIAVLDNRVVANEGTGIFGTSRAALIEGNAALSNGGNGIVTGCTPVRRNSARRNGWNGIVVTCSFDDEEAPLPTHVIAANDVRRNAADGILVRDADAPVRLEANRADGNGDDGIDVNGHRFLLDDDLVWSPDGSLVAGSVVLDRGAREIHLFAADGTGARRLIDGRRPSWSPSGDALAYQAADGIHVVGADGTGDRFLAAGTSPQWSPAGDRILLFRGGSFYAVDASGGTPVLLAAGSDPEWSPDGTRVLYQRLNEIRVVGADGTGDALVWEGGSPTWSPDGERIAFTDGNELVTIRADGTDLRYLTTDEPPDYAPDWSPDGSRIAFLRALGSDVATYVIGAEGGALQRVASGSAPPRWSPAGDSILLGRWIVRPDGRAVSELTLARNPFVTLASNRADRNFDLGIEAAEEVVDGGGNRAKHNGDPRQCVNVPCR
jgi:hypothetical protein